MDIKAVLQEVDISQRIAQLQKGKPQYQINPVTGQTNSVYALYQNYVVKIYSQLDVCWHDVNNVALRPDKPIQKTIAKADGSTEVVNTTEPVNRIALSLQNLIVERAVAFLFGNEVKVNCDDEALLNAIAGVNKDNKIDSFNRQVARTCFQSTEVAEYWYVADTDANNKYGFKSQKKLKCAVFSPLLGDQLYPFFDDYGDMVAFSRKFRLKQNDGSYMNMFETWTNDTYFRYKQVNDGWVEDTNKPYPPTIKKIPIVYAWQQRPEWYNVQSMIDRLEKLLSNFSDTNDYFASPMLFIKNGEALSMSSKGTQGKILQSEGDADAKYLAWSQLPEPIKLEVETLLRFIFSLTQTPDISFESVKGLGTNISGETLKMLFLDAHLKVMNKQEVFDSYLTRRYNIVKLMLKQLNNTLAADTDVECVITPFMLNSETAMIDNLVTAVNGGIMSKESAIEQNPLVVDSTQEQERITNESNASTALDQLQNDPANNNDPNNLNNNKSGNNKKPANKKGKPDANNPANPKK